MDFSATIRVLSLGQVVYDKKKKKLYFSETALPRALKKDNLDLLDRKKHSRDWLRVVEFHFQNE